MAAAISWYMSVAVAVGAGRPGEQASRRAGDLTFVSCRSEAGSDGTDICPAPRRPARPRSAFYYCFIRRAAAAVAAGSPSTWPHHGFLAPRPARRAPRPAPRPPPSRTLDSHGGARVADTRRLGGANDLAISLLCVHCAALRCTALHGLDALSSPTVEVQGHWLIGYWIQARTADRGVGWEVFIPAAFI